MFSIWDERSLFQRVTEFLSSCAATFPDELGMSVPLVEEEQKELLYVPLDGEWGCRTRADECERIIKAMDQLCTLGVMSSNGPLFDSLAAAG